MHVGEMVTMDEKRIYIDEVAAVMCLAKPEETGYGNFCAVTMDPQNVPHETRWFHVNTGAKDEDEFAGKMIPEMTKGPFVEVIYDEDGGSTFVDWWENAKINLLDYAELVDQFRWTFVKNTEGNYVFEKLEKVK